MNLHEIIEVDTGDGKRKLKGLVSRADGNEWVCFSDGEKYVSTNEGLTWVHLGPANTPELDEDWRVTTEDDSGNIIDDSPSQSVSDSPSQPDGDFSRSYSWVAKR